MYKEYFITTPLIFSPVPFYYKDCVINLNGQNGHSYVEGSSKILVDEAFEFIFAIQHCANIPGIMVHLRRESKNVYFSDDPRAIKGEDWLNWAINRIPLQSIPLIILTDSECEAIQKEINNYKALI